MLNTRTRCFFFHKLTLSDHMAKQRNLDLKQPGLAWMFGIRMGRPRHTTQLMRVCLGCHYDARVCLFELYCSFLGQCSHVSVYSGWLVRGKPSSISNSPNAH